MPYWINTITSWDEPPRARHQVTRALADRDEVVFVERNRVGAPGITIRPVTPTLTRVIPSWPVDYRARYRLPVLNELYQEWLYRAVFSGPLWRRHAEGWVINFDHTATRLRRHVDPARLVYYCNDDYLGNGRFTGGPILAYHRWAEQEVARRARFVVATAGSLVDKLRPSNSATHLIPLGAPDDVPGELAHFTGDDKARRPIQVAYVGFMRPDKLGIAWARPLMGDPRFHFTMIGPETEAIRRHMGGPNVTFTGPRSGRPLYELLAAADVCICPYEAALINPGTTPNKVWLYLAMGKPAILTEIPNLEALQYDEDVLLVTPDNAQFPALVERAFAEDSPVRFERRRAVAADNTWARRVDRLQELMKEPT